MSNRSLLVSDLLVKCLHGPKTFVFFHNLKEINDVLLENQTYKVHNVNIRAKFNLYSVYGY